MPEKLFADFKAFKEGNKKPVLVMHYIPYEKSEEVPDCRHVANKRKQVRSIIIDRTLKI